MSGPLLRVVLPGSCSGFAVAGSVKKWSRTLQERSGVLLAVLASTVVITAMGCQQQASTAGSNAAQATAAPKSPAESEAASAGTSQIRIEPTHIGLQRYIQSIQGQQKFLYVGTKRMALSFFIEGDLMTYCTGGAKTIEECKAGGVFERLQGKLQGADVLGNSAYCYGASNQIASNLNAFRMLCVQREKASGVAHAAGQQFPFLLDAGDVYFVVTDEEDFRNGQFALFTLEPKELAASIGQTPQQAKSADDVSAAQLEGGQHDDGTPEGNCDLLNSGVQKLKSGCQGDTNCLVKVAIHEQEVREVCGS